MLHPEDEDQGYILEIPHANQLALYGALGVVSSKHSPL